jgi:NTP pyrophosphatase (non-canonical NTP hydrolase)
MASITPSTTIKQYREFTDYVYGIPNQRDFELSDMLSNIERFAMRSLKGIRKNDLERTKYNLLIALSWFVSALNRLHIDLELIVWNRFPYLCSYCGSCPCACKEKKIQTRQKINIDEFKKPESLEEYQTMFEKIYPSSTRTLDHAGVHLAEELGEFSEAILAYKGEHKDGYFDDVILEAADVFSCMTGIFNSMKINVAGELSQIYQNNCHVCHQAPCACDYNSVIKFIS